MDKDPMRTDAVEDILAGPQPWRRLFLDAMVVEESKGLKRVFHSAEKFEGNPILKHEKPWEGDGVCVGGTIMWMGGKLTMRYRCWGKNAVHHACYAESTDGINWERPNLGMVEYDGSKNNNILPYGNGCIIKVRKPKSKEEQWAMFSYHREKNATVVFSEDTFNWRWDKQKTNLFKTSDVVKFFYDPFEDRYVATYKTPNRRHRAVGIALSKDCLNWYKPYEGAIVGADDLDPDATQFYGMPVFPYQGLYIGLPWIYHARWIKYGNYESPKQMYEAQEGSPRTVDVQLAWSWNLIQWTRTPERKPFIALGPKGKWDWGMIYTARNPVIVGDKLYFYYYGCDNIHDIVDDVRCNIGLATLRIDGFCSMRAGEKEGWFISRREVFETPQVIINAKVRTGGYIQAELLDRWNRILPGFSRQECVPFDGDSVKHVMGWKTKTFPADLQDADKKIRFYLKNADIYSYLPADIDTTRDWGNRKEQ
ncbi:MAG: hypothetical protein QME62_09130 [Armatimonadota bacterium]|nr:hypothetical protein [Armatimonadota bacterium]